MKKQVKKMAAAMTAAAAMAAVVGCSGENALGSAQTEASGGSEAASVKINPAGEFPIVEEPVTLKVAAIDAPYVGALKDVDFVKWYEEKTNVKIEWTEIPQDGYKEKLNLMLSAGNLPDVILGMSVSSSDVFTYGQDGTFLELDGYIDQYGEEIKKIMEENSLVKDAITSPDGHIYALPLLNDCLHNQYRIRSWINTDWLDAVGMEIPTTTEEFEAVLQAFKDQDPNGNGLADEIPMMGNQERTNSIVSYLMNAFIYFNASDLQDPSTMYLYQEDGTLKFTPNQEAYKEGLKWIHSLVEKGLIDSTSFTQDDTQFKQVLQNQDAVSVGVVRADLICSFLGEYNQTDDHRVEQYEILPPLIGPEGFRYQPSYLYASVSPGNFIITNTCQNPEVAFRWADGWYSEEASFYAWYGMEGKGWTEPPEGSIGLNGEPAIYQRLSIDGAEQTVRVTNKFGNNTAKLREGEVYLEDEPEQRYSTEPILYYGTKEIMQYADNSKVVPPLSLTREEISEVSNIRTMIDDYVEENMALFCLGTKDIDAEWDSYVEEFSALGLDRMMEIYQTAYDRVYK